MNIHDDRNDQEKLNYPILVVATDKVLSGWGCASGGTSYAAWSTDIKRLNDTLVMVERRRDMTRVRVVNNQRYRPKGVGHLHIYRPFWL